MDDFSAFTTPKFVATFEIQVISPSLSLRHPRNRFPSSSDSEFFVANKGALDLNTSRRRSIDSEEEEDLWGVGAKYVTILLLPYPQTSLSIISRNFRA